MENNTPPSNLDETLKENLSNYDAKYDSGDWARMERMLDATPKTIATKANYNMALIIGGIVLVGGFAIYKGMNSSSTPSNINTTETIVPAVENKVAPAPAKTIPAPVLTNTIKTETAVAKEQPAVIPEVKTIAPEIKNTVAVVDKKKTDKKTKTTPNDNDFAKNQKVSVMGNEPVFGDMIDSSKGIIHKTKEKESTKKAAVAKGTSSGIGLTGLMNLNADSIRKQKEQMLKDTIK